MVEDDDDDGDISSYDLIELTNDSSSQPDFGNSSTMDGDTDLQELNESQGNMMTLQPGNVVANAAAAAGGAGVVGACYQGNSIFEQRHNIRLMKGSDLDEEEEYLDQSDID